MWSSIFFNVNCLCNLDGCLFNPGAPGLAATVADPDVGFLGNFWLTNLFCCFPDDAKTLFAASGSPPAIAYRTLLLNKKESYY